MSSAKPKNNYFQEIPKPETDKVEQAVILVTKKRDLKEKRLDLIIKAKALRKLIYNLSLEIAKYEAKIDVYILGLAKK
jgi:hypothetical protein